MGNLKLIRSMIRGYIEHWQSLGHTDNYHFDELRDRVIKQLKKLSKEDKRYEPLLIEVKAYRLSDNCLSLDMEVLEDEKMYSRRELEDLEKHRAAYVLVSYYELLAIITEAIKKGL